VGAIRADIAGDSIRSHFQAVGLPSGGIEQHGVAPIGYRASSALPHRKQNSL
jgi:hypothetical protein